jgi:hypothetical protein
VLEVAREVLWKILEVVQEVLMKVLGERWRMLPKDQVIEPGERHLASLTLLAQV